MVKKVAVAAVSLGFASFSTASFADETLRIVSWGGAYQKGQSVGIFQPAAEAMGIARSTASQEWGFARAWIVRELGLATSTDGDTDG